MTKELIAAALPGASEEQREKFARYLALLLEWNGRMNLTAIVDEGEMVQKHFADSVLPAALFPKGAKCVDVGTGAGFPAVPLMIMRGDLSFTLVDSLNKRLVFLETVLRELGLEAALVHARAEDAGQDKALRGRFDIATARAVAAAPVILEWTLPFLKVGGSALLYKGPKANEELADAAKALRILKAEAKVVSFPAPWGERNVIAAKKLAPTPAAYPRKAGVAAKTPL